MNCPYIALFRYPILISSSLSLNVSKTFCLIFWCVSCVRCGSLETISKASVRACLRIGKSLMRSLIFNSGSPCWRVPKNSPGPLSLKSISAILNPSQVLVIIFSLSRASLVLGFPKSRQYDCSLPLPIRPRSWWSWASPNRSAFWPSLSSGVGLR